MERLVEQRPLKRRDRRRAIASVVVEPGELDQKSDVSVSERLPTPDGPLVETILGKQLAAVQVDCATDALHARSALGLSRSRLELLDIYAQPIGRERKEVVG